MTGRVVPSAPRAWLGPVSVLAALAVVVLGMLYGGGSEPGKADARISSALEGPGPGWRHLALAVDFLGEPGGAVPLVLAAVAGCLLLRRPRGAVLVVVAAGTAVVAATLLKHVVGRTIHGDNLSYPSGHTAFLTSLALVAGLLTAGRPGLGKGAGTAVVLGAALVAGAVMGWAQIALGAHYPTDVLGGWCLAVALTPGAAWVVDRTADHLSDASDEPEREPQRPH
ncbi:phosphatase PAP2 family protein [Streptomyces sp. NPDC004539]|uniref:phosphatase PAP2 family protein n=1 Tax=Streptomyces sp. NPDC004539 TaxID=3154280 RepID=UPI00339F120A